VCGAETCFDFADFAVDREALFRSFLVLDHGLPSHNTFSRIFRLIEPEGFNAAFSSILDQLPEKGARGLAIDCKTLRRSFNKVAGCSAQHEVSAFASDRRLALGWAPVAKGCNEFAAARELLALLDHTGLLVMGVRSTGRPTHALLSQRTAGTGCSLSNRTFPPCTLTKRSFSLTPTRTWGRPM
jgi:hypothetical protein